MPFYRFYFLDKSSRIDGGLELNCDNDRDACEHALRMGEGRQWELWHGRQKVACAPPLMDQAKKSAERHGEERE
jgi:hypothetical protein